MTKFSIDQLVEFKRNSAVKSDSAKICGIEEMPTHSTVEISQTYVIEYNEGWTPNEIRVKKYNLDETKKYLFVFETELKAI